MVGFHSSQLWADICYLHLISFGAPPSPYYFSVPNSTRAAWHQKRLSADRGFLSQSCKLWNPTIAYNLGAEICCLHLVSFDVMQPLSNWAQVNSGTSPKSTKLKIRTSRFVGIDKTQKSELRDLSKSTKLTNTTFEICRNRQNLKIRTSRFVKIVKTQTSEIRELSESAKLKSLKIEICRNRQNSQIRLSRFVEIDKT